MKYSETIKKSQTQACVGGYSKRLSCKYVDDVLNENNEKLKFSYDVDNQLLTILSDNFKLLTIEYTG